MSGKMSRDKGKRFELLARKFFQKRELTRTHIGNDDPDIIITAMGHAIAVECKNHASISLAQWWKQADEAAEKYNAEAAVIFHKRKGKTEGGDQWVTMSAEHFERLLMFMEPF